MSQRKAEISIQLNQVCDALILGLVFWISYELRRQGFFILDSLHEVPDFTYFLWILAILMPFGPFLLEIHGFYNHPLEKSPGRSIEQIFRAAVWMALLLAAAAFTFKLTVPSRSVLVAFGVLAPVALLLKDRALAWWMLRKLKKGAPAEPVILAGEPEVLAEIERGMTPSQKLEVKVVERLDLTSHDLKTLVEALHRHAVGRVILGFRKTGLDKIQKAVEACETEGVEAWLSADFIRTSVARPSYENFGRRPMLVFRATPELSYALLFKYTMDRVAAALLLILLAPLFLLIAAAIRLSSPGPVIFRQKRAGLHGKPFTMFKFRTMVPEAEKLQKELEALNEMRGPVFKIEHDPRVTLIGRVLRRTSLDELPQLYNILRGEMSLVGPRPLPLYEVEKFTSLGHRRRLSMKPGLTCLWQIRGRNAVSDFEEWVRMDLEYIDNWSLGLDLSILLRTIPVVLLCRGAK